MNKSNKLKRIMDDLGSDEELFTVVERHVSRKM